MADQTKAVFEKYQFWVLSGVVGLLSTLILNAYYDSSRRSEELQKEVISMSRQVAIVVVKLESYEISQRSIQEEVKELYRRQAKIELRVGKLENEK